MIIDKRCRRLCWNLCCYLTVFNNPPVGLFHDKTQSLNRRLVTSGLAWHGNSPEATCLNTREVNYPDLISEWHPSLNVEKNGNMVTPWDINPSAELPRWWICKTCSHIWHVAPKKRASGRGCLKCARKKMKIAQRLPTRGQSLSECRPEVAKEWHPTANKDEFGTIIKPTQVSRGSGYKATWVCSRCNHIWPAKVCDRTVKNSGCPECFRRLPSKKSKHRGT